MHGQRSENRQRKWHMWPGPSQRSSTGTEADSACVNFVVKAGRKIGVGDCALFRAEDAPFFIGLIKRLSAEKEGNLKLSVNWLYRLGDIKLGKGASFEAAPNEIFYSFHEDEISATALLHPCKVAFLQKDVELPSSVSSFVCRRVYDRANKCLYWLTDQDYTDEHQAEVDRLLDRTKHEMQASSSEGPSQRAAPSPSPLKRETVSASQSMQGRGKKRPRTDQNLEVSKREKLMKVEENDVKREYPMKFGDFASIAEKHEGLTNVPLIDQLFQVMLQERSDSVRKLVDIMSRRTLLASIIAATEKEDCLTHFVQLGGLRILNDWLQEAHKGKLGDGSPKDGDKALEELLLTLIRALGKLPVDLDALRNCIVGKSVNKLRSHRNTEIQRKARELVDMWKKRVNAEMKSDEVKMGTSVAWPSRANEVQSTKVRSAKSSMFLKPGTNGSNMVGDTKATIQSTSGSKEHPTSAMSRETPPKSLVNAAIDVLPVVKEEKSCSSSQSQNNSQSWCSGSVKGGGSWKDEVKPAMVAPVNSKSAGAMLRSHGHSTKSHSTVTLLGPQKDSAGKHKGEKPSNANLADRGANEGTRVELNNQRLIVRLPNPGRSPSHSVSGGSLIEGSATTNRASPPGSLGRHDHTSESIRAAPAHSPVNIADARCGRSNGTDVKEEIDRPCIPVVTEDKDCKPIGFEHRRKDLVVKSSYGNVQKKSVNSNNTSPERLVLDVVQGGGIDLLASVAAGEVIETEKSFSGSSAGEGLPVSTDGGRDSTKQERAETDSKSQKGCKDGELLNEGVHMVCGKGSSFTQESDQLADSPTKCSLVSVEDKYSGDGALVVATQLVSMGNSVTKEVSPPVESGLGGAVCEGEHRDTNSITTDDKEIVSMDNPIAPSLRGQCQMASESSPVDEGYKDSEGVPVSSSPVTFVKGVDSIGCYVEDALEVARQVAMEVEQEVEKYRKPELQDVKLASPSFDIPCSENVHAPSEQIAPGDTNAHLKDTTGSPITTDDAQVSANVEMCTESIEATTEKGKCIPGRSSLDETPYHWSNEDILKQPSIDLVGVSKEASNGKERVSVVGAKEELAEADTELKPCSEKKPSSLDGTAENIDVERPIFDLNEGLVSDEAPQSDATLPVTSPSIPALPRSDSSSGLAAQASSLAAPIAVVAATKGAFIPPSNLTRTKSELGWKGSAATSAFRPAEPRRVAETSQPSCDATTITCASTDAMGQSGKQPRILDIDLNIADERVLEDSSVTPRLPVVNVSEVHADNASMASRPELDLNRVDGSDEHSSLSVSNSRGACVDMARARAPSPAAPRVVLDFDLNDGLGFEEEASSQQRNLGKPSIPVAGGARQSTDSVNVAPWYSSASSMPSGVIMPTFPSSSRPESSHPVIAAPASKSIVTMGPTFGPFSNDLYRGAAVSTSAVPYAGSIPSSFSYGGFPFGAGFSFTSASYNVGSPLTSSTSSPPFLTATPSQLVSAGAVVSPYGRPSMMESIRDIPGMEPNASWVRPCLDLNSGPEVSVDLDTRESTRPAVGLNQFSYHQAASLGGTLKRKEPEGSFDPFRSGFKQTAWR